MCIYSVDIYYAGDVYAYHFKNNNKLVHILNSIHLFYKIISNQLLVY